MVLNLSLIIIGFVLLIKGADFLVDGASKLAKKLHIPEIVIGLTIISIGTSMPELVVSAESALKGHSDIAIGNVIGSNLANMFLILGICSIIKPLYFKRETRVFENPFTALVTTILFIMCKTGNSENLISRKEGLMLLLVCLIFLIYNIIMSKKGNLFDGKDYKTSENIDKINVKVDKSFMYILIGLIGLKIGGDLVVDNASEMANNIGISEKMISLTIVAFSTSLPELITSITATKKGEIDMAIGNVLGSQILNILLIIGITSVLKPIEYSTGYDNDLLILMIGAMLLSLFPYVGEKNKMTKGNGMSFLTIYILYMISLIVV